MARLEVEKHTRSETMDVDQVGRESSLELGQAPACCDQFFHIVACNASKMESDTREFLDTGLPREDRASPVLSRRRSHKSVPVEP